MNTYRFTIQYDGTDFCGWQRQREGRTVQGVLAEAIWTMFPERGVWPTGASRTDSGVHAMGQVVSFSSERSIPPLGLLRGLNSQLPKDLVVSHCVLTHPHFDARRHSIGKTYRYQIWNRPVRAPHFTRLSWHIRKPLDLGAMDWAASALLGENDFSAFRASDCSAPHAMRRIDSISFTNEPNGMVIMEVRGNAFLKQMVRNVMGTLAEVGRGYRPASDLPIILASKDRTKAGVTAPAAGLFLWEVRYPPAPE